MSYQTYDNTYGALTLVFDGIPGDAPEASGLEENFRHRFPASQYLYMQGQLPDADGLLRTIRSRRDSLETDLPEKYRFIFFFYLELSDLTEAVVDALFEMARRFRALQPADDLTDQHFVACFRYRVHAMEPREQQRVYPLLVRLMTEDASISGEVFLLHATALQNFDTQEEGVCSYLYLLSRRNGIEACRAAAAAAYLKVVTYSDFYEDRARRCEERIAAIDAWLGQRADPGLKELQKRIRIVVGSALESFRSAQRYFQSRETLFPVRVTDFEGSFLGGYHSTVSRRDPALLKAKRTYMRDRGEQLLGKADMSSLVLYVRDTCHDPDITSLAAFLDREDAKSRITALMKAESLSGMEQEFLDKTADLVLTVLRQAVAETDPPAKRQRLVEERRRCMKEKRVAGTYSSLEDCCGRIARRTQFDGLQGQLGVPLFQSVLVNARCAAVLTDRHLTIRDLPDPLISDAADPEEIMVTQVFGLLDLGRSDSVEGLGRVLV